jgi:hypothetical protein
MRGVTGNIAINFNDDADTSERLFHELREQLVNSSEGDLVPLAADVTPTEIMQENTYTTSEDTK